MNELYWTSDRVENLKERKRRCVCKFCGNPLDVKSIMFNDIKDARIELYCNTCRRIEYGIEPEIYYSACNFIDNLEVDFYDDLDDNETKHQMNIARVCEIMSWGLRNMGYLNEQGFVFKPSVQKGVWDECLILESNQIPEDDNLEG